MSYLKEFKAAASRTKKLNLDEISINPTSFPIDRTVLNAVEETGHIPFAERAGKTLSVNFGMFHMLSTKFHIPGAILTMGNVARNGEPLLPVTPTHFKKMVTEKTGENALGSYHIWPPPLEESSLTM
ncbi:hypothetical protein [Pseudodesulfovibrio sp. JC047]|uniref:hypothetical protein n=1 Tax=Pseudodesulfovibrio sp. JC047 TaxID=2683199 RepID=UPI001EF2A2B2|nr:hypothetical protein [Pseudodesulfovibrio sp. JC047]